MTSAASSGPTDSGPTYFYTASGATGDIAVYRLDPDRESLMPAATVAVGSGHDLSSIAIDAPRRRLYAADRTRPGIVTFAIDPADGALTELAVVPTQSPVVYLSLSADRGRIFGASYVDGNVCGHTVDADGLACPAERSALPFGTDAHCHCVIETPGGELWVASLGHDRLYRVGQDPVTGRLAERRSPVEATPASGPRHLAFSARRSEVYVIGERDARITAYPLSGQPRTWTTLPDEIRLAPGRIRSAGADNPTHDAATGFPFTWAADLALSPDERLLFSTERSSSTVSVTSALTGELLSWAYAERQPRGLSIDPAGEFLLVTGEQSETVSLFRVQADGTDLGLVDQVPAPVGLLWARAVTFTQ
ncbi:MAG TPA: beta-propeller fold lactonase family protein [Trebonia sp.]